MHHRFILCLGIAAMSAVPAFADDIRLEGKGKGLVIQFVYKGDAMQGFAGQLQFKNLDKNSVFTSYCVDLDNNISIGQRYSVSSSSTADNPVYRVSGSIVSNNHASVNSDNKGAALQIAVWASRYGLNLMTNTGGSFRLKSSWYESHSSIITQAIAMTQAGIDNPMDAMVHVPTTECEGQAQLTPVPEPAMLAALGAGIAAVVRRRRK